MVDFLCAALFTNIIVIYIAVSYLSIPRYTQITHCDIYYYTCSTHETWLYDFLEILKRGDIVVNLTFVFVTSSTTIKNQIDVIPRKHFFKILEQIRISKLSQVKTTVVSHLG